MEKGKGKEKEEGNEASPEKTKMALDFEDSKEWVRKLEEQVNMELVRTTEDKSISGSTQTKPNAMSEDQIALVYELCGQRVPFESIKQMMGVGEGAVDSLELKRVLVESETRIVESLKKERQSLGLTELHVHETESDDDKSDEDEPHVNETDSDDDKVDEENFQIYDPVQWEMATEKETVGGAADEAAVSVPKPFDYMERDVLQSPQTPPGSPNPEFVHAPKDLEEDSQGLTTPEQDFVRALKDSRTGSKPYFRKGDILRVINKSERGTNDPHFELLPLKPPGESGRALIRDFEPADMAAVDAVGRNIRTAKEMDSFRHAVEWEE